MSKGEIAQCTPSTRLYHDLGLYGEIAENCIAVLIDHYHVDMDGFVFDDFFPREFPGDTTVARLFFWLTPLAGWALRRRQSYLPLTLNVIEMVIDEGNWRMMGAKR